MSTDPAPTPLRVLTISTVYQGGGAERCARDLHHGLQARGAETRMFVAARRPEDPPSVLSLRTKMERAFVPLERRLRRPLLWRHLGSRWRLGRIGKRQFDVLHLHNLQAGYLDPRVIGRVARRIPLVWTFHDEWPMTLGPTYDLTRVFSVDEIDRRFGPDNDLRPGTRLMDRSRPVWARTVPVPAAIITASHYIAGLAGADPRYGGVPIHVLPYGLALLDCPAINLPRADARRRLGLPQGARVVLLIANFLHSPFKGMWLAVEALGKLRRDLGDGNDADVRVLLVGNDVHGLREQVPFPVHPTGFITNQTDLATAYRAADVTLVPSVAEGFGYVATESLACRVPVVAFTVGGLQEIIGNNERGLMATRFDTDEIARHLRRLMSDPTLNQQLGDAGHEWVKRSCPMQLWLDAHLSVYRQTIASFVPP